MKQLLTIYFLFVWGKPTKTTYVYHKSYNREKDCLTDEEYISIKDNKEELYELINRVRTELEAIAELGWARVKICV